MRFVCPVAKCGKKVSPEDYYQHVVEYEEEHKDNPVLDTTTAYTGIIVIEGY